MQKIIYSQDDGTVAIITAVGDIADAVKGVPKGKKYTIIDTADLPTNRDFRNGWVKKGSQVVEDLSRCIDIAHDKRRYNRNQQFAPLDIKATIPTEAADAEKKRQAIRVKDAKLQVDIDRAKNTGELRVLLNLSAN